MKGTKRGEVIIVRYCFAFGVRKRIGIDFELFEFSEHIEKEIYRKHFASRARFLTKAIGIDSVARALRPNGEKEHIYSHGMIAPVENDRVIWFNEGFNKYRDRDLWKTYDEKHPSTIGFLRALLGNPSYLEEILRRVKEQEKSLHKKLIEDFIAQI